MPNRYLFMTDEQKSLVELMRQILKKELEPKVSELDEKDEFPMDVLMKLKDAGFYGMDIPEEYGGMGLDLKTCVLLYEEMSKIEAGFSFNFTAACFGFELLQAANAPEEMKRYFVGRLMKGDMGAFCLTEPEAGSDATAIRTTAVRVGDEYILNGSKCFITNGPLANLFIVAAYTDKRKGASKGVSLFLVERERGVETGRKENKMGMRLSVTGDVVLNDVHIPASNLIGEEGHGFVYAMKMIEKGRVTSMVHCLGIAQAAVDIAVEYAKVRKTFGKPIIQHQAVGMLLADMQKRVDAARALLYYGVDALEAGIPMGTLSTSTKVFVSETAMSVTTDAVQVLGGYGYMKDYRVEKLMRDAKIFSIFEGTNQINLITGAKMLSKGES
jgi:alkylation response protein AidB-like acyl-CoA dehydrogenase